MGSGAGSMRAAGVLALWIAGSSLSTAADAPPPPPGADLYKELCATCHDNPKDRIPSRDALAKKTPEEVLVALTTGTMRVQAGGLNLNQQTALATFITGRAPSDSVARAPEKNLCKPAQPLSVPPNLVGQWNGWG